MDRRPAAPSNLSRRLGPAIVVTWIALVATFWCAAAYQIDRTRRESWERAEQTVEQLGRTAEGIVNRQLVQTDGALASLPLLLSREAARPGGLDGAAVEQWLRDLIFQHLTFSDIVVIRADGEVLASARGAGRRRHPKLDSEPLRRASAGGASVLMGPVRNPATGEWSVYVARTLRLLGAPDHVVAAEVPITVLTQPLATIADRAGVTLRLERRDGTLIGGLPHDEAAMGRGATSPHRPLPTKTYVAPASAGGPSAFAIWRPTLYGDLGVALRYETAAAMDDWAGDRDRLLLLVLAASAVISVTAAASLAALRRQGRIEEERLAAQRMLEDAVETMADGFVMWDAQDRLITCNSKYLELYEKSRPFIRPGVPFMEVMRKGAENGQYPQAGDDIDGFLERVAAWRRAGADTMERLLPDGRWLLITERRTSTGGFVGIRTDITEIKRAVNELAVAKERLQTTVVALEQQHLRFDAALNNMSQGLLMGDGAGVVTVCNGRFRALFGLGDDDVVGLPLSELFDRIAEAGRCDVKTLQTMLRRQTALAAGGQSSAFVAVGSDQRAFSITQRPMPEGGFVATYEDVTEQQRVEQRIRHQAMHDALTCLPNRVSFRAGLASALEAVCLGGDSVTMLYLDLDRFKEVNDTLGHPVGDALLVAVAERLRACLRSRDLVARLGGDEFAIAIPGPNSARRAEALGRRILDELSRDFLIDGHRVSVGVSIGAAIACDAGIDADTLMKHADLALYEAKGQGRGRYFLFEPKIAERLRERLDLEQDLRQAVETEGFTLAYQPLFDLGGEAITGFEALLRWRHPERGPISPAVFMPIAEDLGLVDRIGVWVLNRAVATAMRMPGAPRIAVNVSPIQLKTESFADAVVEALQASGLPPDRLELEITETALLADDERILAQLGRLRGLGVRIALDDFGIGYSSLNYIRRVPLDKIKIDQVFVREAIERPDCAAIIRAIVGLARNLGIRTTAEGIETAEQLTLVRKLGCDEGQGYLLGAPGSARDAIRLAAKPQRPPRLESAA